VIDVRDLHGVNIGLPRIGRMRSGIWALGAVAIVAAAGAAPPAHATDRVVVTDPTASNVSAHNTQVVWSSLGRDGRARLMRLIGGSPRKVPVRSKDGLFDPDTDTGRSGHQVIVYTRCAGLSGQGCDIWRYDDGKRRERKVTGASTERCSEFAPSIWIGTVAFARSGPGKCPGLYVVRRGKVRRLEGRVPAKTDIRGSTVAYLYTPAGDPAHTSVRVRSIYGRSRRVVSGLMTKKESYRVTSPVLDGRFVYWLQEDQERHEFFGGRGLVRRGSTLEFTARTFPGRVDSIAVALGRAFYTSGPGIFEATDPPPGFASRD
jgi:hypothetical protein